MTRYRFVALALVVILISTVGASAQTDSDSNASTQKIDDEVTLVSWDYDDDRGGFVLVFNSTEVKEVTITEAVQFREGSGSGNIYSERVLPGRSEIFVEVPRRGGEAAVTLTTPASIEANSYSYVSTGQTESDSASPFAGTSSTAGWIGGAALALVSVVLAGSYKMRRESREPEVAK
jgi:hypothetical protein